MISNTRAGVSPAFQNVCHCSRGLTIKSPGLPITTVSPSNAPILPSRTKLYSSSRWSRCMGAAKARGCIGCSTSAKCLPASSPSMISRAPRPPKTARWPSRGPRTLGDVMKSLFQRSRLLEAGVWFSADMGLERAKGIEPSYAAWEAAVLPLNYARIGRDHSQSRPRAASALRLEVLRQLQALRLVVGADAGAVERIGLGQHLLVDEAADGLAVLENERHLARAHLEHRARAGAAGAGIAEAGVEEAGIVHAEFTDQGIERHHLGGIAGRHLHGFLGRQNIKFVRIEDQAVVGPRLDRLPEIEHRIAGAALDVDDAGMTLGAVADDAAGVARARRQQIAGEIDAEDDALADVGLGVVDETLACVQVAQLVGGELRMTVAEADLRQPRAFAHQHREGARRNLGIERAAIAGLDAVEAARLVGDDAGEDVEPAGRALRIGGGGDVLRQRQAFQQRHDIDAAGLQHRAVGKRELVQLEIIDA